MKQALVLAAGLAAGADAHAAAAAADCPFKEPREARVEVAGATRLRLIARAGTLDVAGVAGAREVVVQGQACASSAGGLAGVKLRAERQGSEIVVEAVVPEDATPLAGGPALDLVVRLPASLALEVSDTSGPLEIRGVGALRLEDSSGEALVEDVASDVTLRDSSGDLTVRRVGGALRILQDSSGQIDVVDVRGSVTIDEDSSGGIRVEKVGGSVVIKRDSSGGIDVRDVAGDLVVEQDGSGGVRHEGVKGRVSLPKR